MFEFELMIIIMFFNIIINIKRIPVINFVFGLFTFYFAVTTFINYTNVPANPLLSIFIALLGLLTIILGVLEVRRE